ncbi:MAG TPA: VOC family protein [Povalibacter sp.]|nr:VOC family protein [Povalibacter sp.]
MSKRNHTIDFVEFPVAAVPQIASVRQFYGSVFGWQFKEWGEDYIDTADSQLGCGFNADGAHRATQPLVVIYSTDLEAARRGTVAAGGTISREIFSFPGGRRCHFIDPAGNELAVWSDR